MKRSIRVLNVILEERVSGPTRRILGVAQRLVDRGIETVVAMPKGENDDFRKELAEKGIPYKMNPSLKRLRNTKNPGPNVKWLASLPVGVSYLVDVIRKERADIVHCNGLTQIVGAIAGKRAGAKILWHLNDVAVPKYISITFRKIILHYADLVAFASRAVKVHFGPIPRDLKAEIVYAPVNCDFFDNRKAGLARDQLRSTFGIPEKEKVVGMVGNVNYLKGVSDFVDAAAIISQRRPNVKFLHVGAKLKTKAKLYRDIQNKIQQYGMSESFILAGKRSNVRDFLAAMDVFIIPSLSEACPISLLEAMAMEKPIVATSVGGIPELVRDGEEALLIPARSPESIARKVSEYLDSPMKAYETARKARARAERLFDISRCVDAHEQCYRELVQ